MTHGLTVDVLAASGLTAERPMETGLIWSPNVTGLEDGWLLFDPLNRSEKKPNASLAVDFADLADKDDQAILKFAKKWGVLNVGSDGWKPKVNLNGRESLAGWRILAGRLRAAINIGSSFHLDQLGLEKDWISLAVGMDRGYSVMPPWLMKNHPFRDELENFILFLIRDFSVAPRFWWNKSRQQWQIDLDSCAWSNLPAILIIQTMLIIADKDGFAICSNCHRSYIPERKPDPTRRNYCKRPPCGKRAAWRDAARERRQRERDTKELANK